jgi:hypothetical protein
MQIITTNYTFRLTMNNCEKGCYFSLHPNTKMSEFCTSQIHKSLSTVRVLCCVSAITNCKKWRRRKESGKKEDGTTQIYDFLLSPRV